MALVQVNWRPNRNELRNFGFISLAAFGALGAWLWFQHSIFGLDLEPPAAMAGAYVAWTIAALSLIGSLIAPLTLRPLYVTLTAISLPVGFVVSHVLMAVVFYGFLTPLGIVFKLMGRDALQRRFEPGRVSYWEPRRRVTDKMRYFRQF